MKNFDQPNPKTLQTLLNIASKKLGTTPDILQRQLKDGTFQNALSSMPGKEAALLRKALSDPKTAEKILSTPQAKAVYDKLNK